MGFGVVEFLVKKFLHFEEISGFAAEQMIRMPKYDQILYEIGEKYQPKADKKGMPPEIKLMGVVLFNAVVFVGMKMLMGGGSKMMSDALGGGGGGGGNSFGGAPRGGMSGGGMSGGGMSGGNGSRKPMKKPDIDLDDL